MKLLPDFTENLLSLLWHFQYIVPYLLKIFYLFNLYECFAPVYVCIWSVCLMPLKARRGHQIVWDWSYRRCGPPSNPGPLEEQPEILTTEVALKLHIVPSQCSPTSRLIKQLRPFLFINLLPKGQLCLHLFQELTDNNSSSSLFNIHSPMP